jgi:hypothetical protein
LSTGAIPVITFTAAMLVGMGLYKYVYEKKFA